MTPAQRATAIQAAASHPEVSAFVAASAGSGKTKLLVDRLLRLMLGTAETIGAEPGRILCLTFTRAGAAEMAIRLRRELARWVTLPDAQLDTTLAAFGLPSSPALRGRARALFARVLDLPGGMRIDTIHGFCQSLLRRFPLEASVPPRFRLMEDRDAAAGLSRAREQALDRAASERPEPVALLSGLLGADAFAKIVGQLHGRRALLSAVLAMSEAERASAYRRVMGVANGPADRATLIADAVAIDDGPVLAAARGVAAKGAKTCAANATAMLDWLSLDPARRAARWGDWASCFLKVDGQPYQPGTLASKSAAEHGPVLVAEAERVAAIEETARALDIVSASLAMLELAEPILGRFAEQKSHEGLLDYEDLIERADALLDDPGAAWVHFKLDGGIDHLLLDEVQDTAPAQWRIAARLVEEFFAGAGTRATDAPRTVFAVGDRKQSIFSFQGADPSGFDQWRSHFRERAGGAGLGFVDEPLDVSFRSSAAVLGLVDRVFADPEARRGVVADDAAALAHQVARADAPGWVELWPLAPRPEKLTAEAWRTAAANRAKVTAERTLAERLANWIDATLADPDGDLRPGDVMILLQRRTAMAVALVNALKARGVPVAGMDRMTLVEQPAVADLLALCDAVLLPEDDLSVACVLTSPLGGVSDNSLMALAMERPGSLIDALRDRAGERVEWAAAWAMIARLRARADYVSPHALLTEALGALGGRARLLARLGAEAADPIDELLNAALEHEASHPPSLQDFVQWVRSSDAELKRESEGSGGLVRVMTVHGAKGLESKLVILPDTVAGPAKEDSMLWARDGAVDLPLLVVGKKRDARASTAVRLARAEATSAERNRLLYVALTRARDRLVVCGHEPKKVPATSWYRTIARAMEGMAVERSPFDGWAGEIVSHRVGVAGSAAAMAEGTATSQPMPAWAGQAPTWRAIAPDSEQARPSSLAPSRPEGVELGPVPRAASPVAMREAGGGLFRRGALIHSLLQHLPAVAAEARRAVALRWLSMPGQSVGTRDALEALADEVMAVLEHPELEPLFAPGSRAEVPLTGKTELGVIGGLVDRLAVTADRVLVADYKTGRDGPKDVADTPALYVRQMAAYRSVLRGVYPGRAVVCALVWTRSARVMVLPDTLLDGGLMRDTQSPISVT